MKYLNEFEEFNPDDFSDDFLQGDLSDLDELGFDLFKEGKDYGFGPDLKGTNDGKNVLFVSDRCREKLIESGIFEKTKYDSGMTTFLSEELWAKYRSSVVQDHKLWLRLYGVGVILIKDATRQISWDTPLDGIPKREGAHFYYIYIRGRRGSNKEFPQVSIDMGSKKPKIGKDTVISTYDFVYNKIKGLK
jgi:hypothetical protein